MSRLQSYFLVAFVLVQAMQMTLAGKRFAVILFYTSLGIAIPGSRDSRIPGSGKFSNPEIPGLSRTQSRDFGINKIYLFNGLFSTF